MLIPDPKAASTNWMHNLLVLAGKTEAEVEQIVASHPQQPNHQGRVVAPVLGSGSVRRLLATNTTAALLIVRHPFDRLVSAFRDKLEQCHGPQPCSLDQDWYHKQYGARIVARYRQQAIAKAADIKQPRKAG